MDEAKILTMLEEDIPLPDDADSFDDEQMGLLWDALHVAAPKITKLVNEEFTEAITKALDSYIIQLDARRELNDELRAENTQLLAQLAGMAGRLEEIHDYIERYVSPAWRDFHMAEIFVMVEEALSAAPEVLWAGEAKLMHWGTDEEPFTRLRLWIPGHIGTDGEQVKVIVVKEQGDDKKGA